MAIHGEFTTEAYNAIMSNAQLREALDIPATANQDSVALYFQGADSIELDQHEIEELAITREESDAAFSWIIGIDGNLIVQSYKGDELSLYGFRNTIRTGQSLSLTELAGSGFSPLNTEGLSGLVEVGASLLLSGLSEEPLLNSLESVGGSFSVTSCKFETLDNFSSLTRIGGYKITIESNANLTNIDGLSSLTTVESYRIYIQHNPLLENLNGLSNAQADFDSSSPYLYLISNGSLTDISGLFGFSGYFNRIYIQYCPLLLNLSGLEKVTRVSALRVQYNDSLEDISALSGIKTSYAIYVTDNPSLRRLGFSEVVSSSTSAVLEIGNQNLENLTGIPFINHTGYISVSTYNSLSDEALEDLSFEAFSCAPNNSRYNTSLVGSYPFEMALWNQAYPNGKDNCEIVESVVFNIPDATPNPFSFETLSGVEPDEQIESSVATIDDFDGELNVHVTGGLDVLISKNGGIFSSGEGLTIVKGDTIQLKTTAPSISDSTAVVSVHIGSTTGRWMISTSENDTPVVDKPIGELTYKVGDVANYSLKGVFVDPNNHEITYRLVNGPVSLNAESGSIEGKVTLNDIGEYNAILEAVDEQGAVGLDFFDLKVLPPSTGVGDEFNTIRDAAGEGELTPEQVEEFNNTLFDLYSRL